MDEVGSDDTTIPSDAVEQQTVAVLQHVNSQLKQRIQGLESDNERLQANYETACQARDEALASKDDIKTQRGELLKLHNEQPKKIQALEAELATVKQQLAARTTHGPRSRAQSVEQQTEVFEAEETDVRSPIGPSFAFNVLRAIDRIADAAEDEPAPVENLQSELMGELVAMEREWEKAANKSKSSLRGGDWLQKALQSTAAACMHNRVNRQGRSYWTCTEPEQYACQHCTSGKRCCLKVVNGGLVLLPLHPEVRETDDASAAGFYRVDGDVPASKGRLWEKKVSKTEGTEK
ncbi:uncharacterized protein LTR77_010610 [Saxophila tyrrhenica]|uniref:Uncharacterized protein n=1 Tax=Saxophila tyrrhenica TaxID=1690608 RepID=A0AAV9NY40_9PEZI|nr:hypothetical protein LTR77_010610 [Saxophila tyrrhenica]